MSNTMEVLTDEDNRAMIASRIIKAPRSLVYKLFTEKEYIDAWYGPQGCKTETSAMDVREGGIWTYKMNMPNGSSFDAFQIFTEVVKDKKLVFDSATDENTPEEKRFVTQIDFKDHGEDTELTITMSYRSDEMFEQAKQYGAMQAYGSAFDKLAEYITTV